MAARLARLRRRARIVLWIEALTVAAMAPLGVVALVLILALVGAGGWIVDALGLAGLAASAWYARRAFRAPEPAAIDRRIERDSGLAHRPIAALEDRPAPIEGAAAPLWTAYRARLDRAIEGAKVGVPAPDFASHDPFALRALLLLGLVAAWIAAGPQAGSRLAEMLAMPRLFAGPALSVQAWITPPRWTGRAPRLIGAHDRLVHALTGASLSLIVTGAGDRAPAAWIGGKSLGFARLDRGSYRATRPLLASTRVVVGPFWHRIARFRIDVAAAAAPRIGFTIPPHADGKRIDLSWRAESRYGLRSLALRYRPISAPQAGAKSAALAHGKRLAGAARLDLLASPYAGLGATGRLVAVSPADLTGRSAPAQFTLPMPHLVNRTAQALEAVRRALALTPMLRPALAQTLVATGRAPPGPVTPGTAKAIRRFAAAFAAGTVTHPEAPLWTLVRRAEQGIAYRSARQLDAARRALEQALARALAGQPETARQLRALLDRLNQASQAHLSALARQGMARNQSPRPMAMSAIDRLARRIAREAAAGQTARARRDMERLRRMLNRLQSARPMSAAQAAAQQAERKSAQALSRLMRRESRLMDRTARRGPPPMGNSAGQKPGPHSQALARQQQGLRMSLQATQQAMAQAGLPAMAQLGAGKSAMAGAEAHLRAGDRAGAMPAERAAIVALQQAAGALQSMRLGHGNAGGPVGLGRQAAGGHGRFGTQDRGVLSLGRAGADSEARRIENDLIRRDARPGLPAPAHHYYHRLLGDKF